MLFLGAGASKAVGIEDLQGITRLIREALSPDLQRLVSSLDTIFQDERYQSLNIRLDLEVLYTVLDNLLNRDATLRELGPYAIVMDKLLENNEELANLRITTDQFRKFQDIVAETIYQVIDDYRNNESNKARAITLYDELFKLGRDGIGHFVDTNGIQINRIFNFVVSLNYDMVLELYSKKRDKAGVPIPYFDRRGFKDESGTKLLDLQGILHGTNKPDYVKLHGSIDWWENENGDIVESYPSLHIFETLIRRSIIYPIYEKHVSRDPFFTLYQYFRRRLSEEELALVIGYSFRDPSVNNAFVDWLRLKHNARLVVVARRTYQDNILRIFQGMEDRVEFVTEYFGEDNFIDQLTLVLARRQ